MNKILDKLQELYIFFLPITIFGLKYPFGHGGIFSGVSSYLMLINLILLIIFNPKKFFLKITASPYSGFILFYFIFISLFMSNIIHIEFGVIKGYTSYEAVFRQSILLIHIYVVIVYNRIVIENLKLRKIINIMKKSFLYLIFFTLIELLIVNFFLDTKLKDILIEVDKIINPGGIPLSKLVSVKKIKSLTEEPSMLGAVFSIYILPFFLFVNTNLSRIKKITYVLLIIIILIYSKSSTSLIGIVIISIYTFIKEIKKIWKYGIFLLGIILINFNLILEKGIELYQKIFKLNNLSSIHRYSSVYTNFKGLLDYPIFGYGWGNSGFFYLKYFPKWAFQSEESKTVYYSDKLPFTGGGITIEYITSFGIIGIIIIMFVIKMHLKKIRNTPIEDYIKVSIILIAILGIASIEITGRYYALFIISLFLETKPNAINFLINDYESVN